MKLVKTGLYDFNENLHAVRVLDGEAVVKDARTGVRVKAGHMVDLSMSEPLKARKFDKKEVEAEDLYRWTSLRSSYLAEANVDNASWYAYGGYGWYGDGWYWDPWFDAFTIMPWDGIFFSPFGWGFYSPWCAFGAPIFWGGGHYYHHFGANPGAWGPGPHYGHPANYGHGVHYAPGLKEAWRLAPGAHLLVAEDFTAEDSAVAVTRQRAASAVVVDSTAAGLAADSMVVDLEEEDSTVVAADSEAAVTANCDFP